jgi:large subunit ribosomal protein L25
MEIRELTIQRREGTGKQRARRLRREGRVPAIMYGGGEPVTIAVDPREIARIMHGHEGGTQLLRVSLSDSGDSRMVIIRDMQLDPVSERIIHVDLQEVRMDRAIQVAVPLRHVGEPIGVKEAKGILEMILREVQVSCLPGAIPEMIDANVTGLGIHDVLTVGDLVVPAGVRILTDPGQAVATVAPPMAEEVVAAPVAAPVATEAEPEVLTERKPKDEDDEKKK